MANIKNIYNEIIQYIKNMTDKQMIDEMISEGCVLDINKSFSEQLLEKSMSQHYEQLKEERNEDI